MAAFDIAVGVVLEHEGGYVVDTDDPGGETKFGISKRAYPDQDIKNMTEQEAVRLYRRDYWREEWGDLPQELATALLDASVNMGRTTAIRLLQEALNAAGGRVLEDGVYGRQTQTAVIKLDTEEPGMVVRELRARRALRYVQLTKLNPTLEKYLSGWIRRAVV